MDRKQIAGVNVELTDDGYFVDPLQWTKEIALELAKEVNISLSEQHFEVIDFIREKFLEGEAVTIRAIGKSGIVDVKGFYRLFPGAPLKKAAKVSGIPKPESCI